MQKPFEVFEQQAMRALAKGRVILDVGGGSRFMKGMEKYKNLFDQCDYRTLDVSSDYHPDIVGDIHAIPLPDNAVDGIICRSVLEHVERPWDAVNEMYRILKPGGFAFIQVPSTYPYHARTGVGAYPDYWRFFESSLRLMTKKFTRVDVQRHGGWFQAMSFFFPGQVRLRGILNPVAFFLDRWFQTEKRTTTACYSILVQK